MYNEIRDIITPPTPEDLLSVGYRLRQKKRTASAAFFPEVSAKPTSTPKTKDNSKKSSGLVPLDGRGFVVHTSQGDLEFKVEFYREKNEPNGRLLMEIDKDYLPWIFCNEIFLPLVRRSCEDRIPIVIENFLKMMEEDKHAQSMWEAWNTGDWNPTSPSEAEIEYHLRPKDKLFEGLLSEADMRSLLKSCMIDLSNTVSKGLFTTLCSDLRCAEAVLKSFIREQLRKYPQCAQPCKKTRAEGFPSH